MLEPRREAYVTLCANEAFFPGVRCLARSLDGTGPRAPLICLVPEQLEPLARLRLGTANLLLLPVTPLPLSDEFIARHANGAIEAVKPMTLGNKPAFHERLLNFLKLRVWELGGFGKIVFLDADTVVLKNIDRLFDYPAFSAAPNLYASLGDFHRINSGVFVCEPGQATFRRMLTALDAPGAFWPRTDQTFLETYFQQEGRPPLGLPHHFNTLQYVWFNLPDIWSWRDAHVIHYQFEKPWDEASFEASAKSRIRRRLLAPLIDAWHVLDAIGRLPERMQVDNLSYLRGLSNELAQIRALEGRLAHGKGSAEDTATLHAVNAGLRLATAG